jgi:hypothetical protein
MAWPGQELKRLGFDGSFGDSSGVGHERPRPTSWRSSIHERVYSGSGRSWVSWHSVQTQVRITTLVWSSRRNVHGMNAALPHRGHRSGLAPGGS